MRDLTLYRAPVTGMSALDPSGYDETEIFIFLYQFRHRGDQILNALIGCNLTKKKESLPVRTQTDTLSCFPTPKRGSGTCIIDPKRDNANSRRGNIEVSYQCLLHRGVVHQNMVTKPILDA